ncbi:MAG: phage portal protein [Mesorhizobium sp.]
MAWNWPWKREPDRAGARISEAKSTPGFIALHQQGEAQWPRRDYAGLAREGFMRNAVVYRCAKLICESAASLPWLLYQGEEEVTEHPVLSLIGRPNPRQSGEAMMETVYGHLLIGGSAYVEMTDGGQDARELHVLRPDRVSVLADGSGWPVAVDYRTGTTKRRIALGAEPGPGALQLTLFHPLDDHYGFAPLEAASMALGIQNAAQHWNKALLDNSARPSGALVYAPKDGGNMPDDQYDRLKAELEERFSGPSRAGRPMLLEGDLDWKAMSLTPKDMDFAEARNGAARDIALAFGVPPMLLGIPGDNTYANYAEANRAFWRLTVMPLVGRIAGEFSHFLSAKFGEDLRLRHDADAVDGLSLDREALWRRVNAADFLTEDEKRQAVGYGPKTSAS